ncbi:hypothetical protein Acr_16g0002700 [Actinidia rufa]|uniref:Uncharacterized protein n=1 Tax=Actinidia rufa TaxID=165716 RepID=A0A7J0FYA1_9ERIC|nr:hypothetical protein Acr_16g0002700 [Actinidia rufa]
MDGGQVTFQNIGKLFANFEPGPVLDTLDELFTGMVRGIRAAPINFPGTAYHHAVQCRRKVEAIFREELKRRKKNPEEANSRNDLMDGLMQLKDDEGNQLRDIEVVDNIVSIVVAGYESTSIAIMWALYFLAKYSNILQKLREENRAISKRKNGELITSDDISNMKYTNKEPLKPGVYQVFGGGSRTCAGNMLARLQLAVFLHHLAVGYKWELVNPNAQMTYLPHPKPVDGVEIVISKLEEAK